MTEWIDQDGIRRNYVEYVVTGINPEPWRTVGVPRRGTPVKDGKLVAYQLALKEDLPLQNGHVRMFDGNLKVTFFFWRSSAHGKPADTTNLQKATEDALQEILYTNDKSNRHVESVLCEQEPTTLPHIVIRIAEFDPSVIPVVRHEEAYTERFRGLTWRPDEEDPF